MANITVSNGWENLPAYISYSIEGFVIGGGNLLIVLGILRYEALRSNKEYILMMALSLADTINMTGFLTAGFHRIHLLMTGHHNDLVSPTECVYRIYTIIWSFSLHLANLMLTVVSLDRLLCVFCPLRYLGWSTNYALCLVGIASLYSVSTGLLGLAMTLLKGNNVPSVGARCITSEVLRNTTNSLFTFHFNSAPSFFALFSVVIYVLVAIEFRRKNDQVGENQEQLKRQRKFTKSLGISCLCTFFFFVLPFSFGNVLAELFKWPYLPLVLWSFSNLNAFCNVFIYSLRHREIRQALYGLFVCKQMPVDVRMWKVNEMAAKPSAANQGFDPSHVERKLTQKSAMLRPPSQLTPRGPTQRGSSGGWIRGV